MLSLEHVLRDLVNEARSRDGVSGRAVCTALAAAEQAERQITALRRIIAELSDDGISHETLEAAEKTLGVAEGAGSASGTERKLG